MGLHSTALRSALTAAAVIASALATGAERLPRPPAPAGDDKKASISVKANPSMGFSPARVVATAEVKGGPNDAEDLYCASVEWIWGDDTRSESKVDCEPYEKGRSEIRRRYTLDHTYQTAGNYRIEFYLKQKNKRVLGGRTSVNIRPGARDIGPDWR